MEEHTIYSCHELGFERSELIIISKNRNLNYHAIDLADYSSKYLGRRKEGVALFNVSKLDIENFNYIIGTKVKPKKRFYIDYMSNNSLNHIESKCKELKQNINLRLAIIVYSAHFKKSEIEVSKRLKKLSEELKIDIFLMTSFPREHKPNRPPILNDRQYKALIEFADMAWIVHINYEKTRNEIYVIKNTHGSTGIIEKPPQEYINKMKNKKLKEDKLL